MIFKQKVCPKNRLSLLCIVFVFAYVSLFVRVWQLHVFADKRISKMEKRSEKKIRLSSRRKTIYDRMGRPLALSLKVPSVFVDPESFMPSKAQLAKISGILGMSSSEIKRKIKRGSRRFAWLKRFSTPGIEEKIGELDVPGIHHIKEWKRFYPDKELAGQVLGFVGVDGKGLEGLEKHYDDYLRREEVTIKAKRDGRGRVIYSEDSELNFESVNKDLYLSIDANIQFILEEEMASAARRSDSKSAMGLMMDSENGEILAMASYPLVNPNRFSDFFPSHWRNRAAQEVFEPGSTFKVFTVAAALDQKVIKPDQIFKCTQGSLAFGSKEIRNEIDKDWLTPKDILKYSNNVGIARIGLEMKKISFFKAIQSYGFGFKTGLDYPGEAQGLLSQPEKWYPIDVANISFGQGIGVSAAQMVGGFSALANGGHQIHPKLTLDGPIAIQNSKKKLGKKIMSKNTANLLKNWLESVTDFEGTGKRAWVDGYRFAGKTGTAQLFENASYSHTKFFSSFVGMGPMPKSRYVLMVAFKEPKKIKHGGQVAAPVFASVMKRSLKYLQVEPDHEDSNMTFASFEKKLSQSHAEKHLDNGVEGESFPNFKGRTLREMLIWAKNEGIQLETQGSGVVYDQSPLPGSDLKKNLKVYLSSNVSRKDI